MKSGETTTKYGERFELREDDGVWNLVKHYPDGSKVAFSIDGASARTLAALLDPEIAAERDAYARVVLALSAQLEGLVGAVVVRHGAYLRCRCCDHLTFALGPTAADHIPDCPLIPFLTPSSALVARDVEMVRVGLEAAAKAVSQRAVDYATGGAR